MSATSEVVTRTVPVSSNQLDTAIEVLSSAAREFQLTRFQRLSYRALIVSLDVVATCYLALEVVLIFVQRPPFLNTIILLALLVGMLAFVLNIPLFLRVFRERARLKKLGLSSLSKSLWKESRRSRWISRIRGAVLMTAAITGILDQSITVILFFYGDVSVTELIPALIVGLIVFTLFAGTQYLRNQRERMELTASAEDLKKALQSLQQRRGAEVISVPSELLEQTAKIESAQIAKERKDAILESVTSPASGYAIAFDRDAAEQRATLEIADRVALEDLVEQLSTDGTQVKPQGATGQGRTKNNRIEINYVIDNASCTIRVIAVRHVGEVSDASVNGVGHA
jgi:hypothetical protein